MEEPTLTLTTTNDNSEDDDVVVVVEEDDNIIIEEEDDDDGDLEEERRMSNYQTPLDSDEFHTSLIIGDNYNTGLLQCNETLERTLCNS